MFSRFFYFNRKNTCAKAFVVVEYTGCMIVYHYPIITFYKEWYTIIVWLN